MVPFFYAPLLTRRKFQSTEPMDSTVADLLAGFLSGTISTLAVHPIDTVLTRYQARGGAYAASAAASQAVANASASAPAAGPVVEARALAASFGLTSLWRGAPALVGAAPFQNALLMAGYGVGRRWSSGVGGGGTDGEHLPSQERLSAVFVGGCVGGVLQCLVASPAELFKVRSQVLDMITSPQGTKPRLTAGMGATVLRDGIPHGIWFASYEWCKGYLGSSDKSVEQQSWAVPLFSGAFAASVAWGVGYPADLIKTRIQAGRAEGILQATQELVAQGRTEGRNISVVRILYRGFSMKLARAVPASAIGFVTYEYAIAAFEGKVS